MIFIEVVKKIFENEKIFGKRRKFLETKKIFGGGVVQTIIKNKNQKNFFPKGIPRTFVNKKYCHFTSRAGTS